MELVRLKYSRRTRLGLSPSTYIAARRNRERIILIP